MFMIISNVRYFSKMIQIGDIHHLKDDSLNFEFEFSGNL